METQPLISVIIPVYNVANYLPRCLDSLLAQTYKNLEIIVVDDGSTDNGLDICKEYAQKDKRITVIHQENKGLSAARNTGIDIAIGEFLAFLDADDWVPKNAYQILLQLQQQTNADISEGNMYYSDGDKNEILPCDLPSISVLSKEKFLSHIPNNPFSCNKLFSRQLFTKGLRFNPDYSYAEDVEFDFQLLQHEVVFAHTNTPTYYYFQHPQSMIRTLKVSSRENSFRAWGKLYEWSQRNSMSSAVTQKLLATTQGAACVLLIAILLSKEKHTNLCQEVLQWLKQHQEGLFSASGMGLPGKIFAWLILRNPSLVRSFCQCPGLHQYFNYYVPIRISHKH